MKKNNKVIVFGGAGFLGSHISDCLTRKGFEVTIFDIKKSPYLKSKQKMIIGDILDNSQIDKAIKGHNIVYNFAGISDIDECHNRPIDTLKYNLIGNAQILHWSCKNKVSKYVFASSAYVYSDSGSFYRISKQASESFIESFSKINNIDYVILRYGSLYGDRADERNSIYKILLSALTKKKIIYRGTGDERREYINVKDAAELSVKALDKDYKNQILMLTGNNSLKYSDLISMINEILKNKVKIEYKRSLNKTHYKMSPYSFNPRTAKKITSNQHIDLGQGLLTLIEKIYNDLHTKE